jgi:hypothetical protein
MTTAAELDTARTAAAPIAGTAPTPGTSDSTAGTSTGSPGAGTFARGTTAGTGTAAGSTPKTALQAHKLDDGTATAARTTGTPDAGTVAPSAAGPAAPAPGDAAGAPDAGLLLDLRRLWTRPPTARTTAGKNSTAPTARTTGTPAPGAQAAKPLPSARLTARKPTAAEILAARAPACCGTHTDPDGWTDEPAPRRPGWLQTTCRRCGALVGYRPADPENGDVRRRRLTGEPIL